MSYIYGRNPVLEALEHRKNIQKIFVLYGTRGEKIRRIYKFARQQNIPITNANISKIKQFVGEAPHQGVVALMAEVKVEPFETFLARLPELPSPFCLLILDRIQSPHNFGAIIRSAEVLGCQGIIYSVRDSVPVTDAVVKASAGAALHFPIFKAANLANAIEELKRNRVWVYGASLHGEKLLWEMDLNRNCAIILGSEEKGIRPLLEKKCDELFRIPQVGKIQSLNVSVSAGIVLSEVVRQRTYQGE